MPISFANKKVKNNSQVAPSMKRKKDHETLSQYNYRYKVLHDT